MSVAAVDFVPSLRSAHAAERLRQVFSAAGFGEEGVCRALGVASVPESYRIPLPALERRTAGGSALEVLFRLFLAGLDVPLEAARAALGKDALAAFEAAGLTATDGVAVQGRVLIAPLEGLWIASDRMDRHAAHAADFVLGAGPVTRLLAGLAMRRPVESTLDLGCGCGALALLAAGHSKRVAAADLNDRAVSFAAFNGVLNGLEMETLRGDLFAPVAGRRFDLIVCNPPYVISPERTYVYRDGGAELCRRVLREAPAHLAEGGCLQMLCNWPQRAGADWRDGLAQWFEGLGCDAWVLRINNVDAAGYAAAWLGQEYRDAKPPPGAFERWVDFLEAQGIASVGGGLVVLRRAPGGRKPWLELREAPPLAEGAGETIARTLEARDLLGRVGSGDALLDVRLRPSPDLEQRRRLVPGAEGWRATRTELRLTRGLMFSAGVDPVAADLVGLLDGRRSLREAAEAYAEASGVPAEFFLGGLPAAVARLLELGLLVPAAAAEA